MPARGIVTNPRHGLSRRDRVGLRRLAGSVEPAILGTEPEEMEWRTRIKIVAMSTHILDHEDASRPSSIFRAVKVLELEDQVMPPNGVARRA